jgi:aspartyl-tRNA(Asn)/glutamyl-tRNA(Gln) amidotransferase subunit C
MITKEDIQNLATLARIEIGDEEMGRFQSSLEDILVYISEIREISDEETISDVEGHALRNIFRDDGNPHEAERYTSGVLKNAPDSENGYLKVKKIL